MSNKIHGSLMAFYVLVFFTLGFGPWLQHVVTCFKADSWGFLIAGAIAFPLGWVHGVGLWMGVW